MTEVTETLQLQSAEDWIILQNRYLQRVAEGWSGTLSGKIAPGTYSDLLFQAVDPMGESRINLELLAEGPCGWSAAASPSRRTLCGCRARSFLEPRPVLGIMFVYKL